MPDLSITVGSVAYSSGSKDFSKNAGATITAGQAVYLDTDTDTWKLADANGAAAAAVVGGIALHGSLSGQPLCVQTDGDITIGATLIAGMTYVLSATAGGIAPITDVDDDFSLSIIGVATSSTVLHLHQYASATTSGVPGFLSQQAVVDRVVAATAEGTSSVNGDILDMGAAPDYDGVLFILILGSVTDGTPGLKAQSGADSGLSDAADLAGTSVTVADTNDNKLVLLDIVKPAERYVRCVALRGGSTGCVIDGGIALRYRARTLPVSQGSDVAGAEQHLSPAEGTA